MTHSQPLPAPASHTLYGCVIAYGLGLFLVNSVLTKPTPEFVGVVQAEVQIVTASTSGTVSDLMVSEGDQVTQGTPLAQLTDPELDRLIAAQRLYTQTLQGELTAALERSERWVATRTSDETPIRTVSSTVQVTHMAAHAAAEQQTKLAHQVEIHAIEERLVHARENLNLSLKQRDELTLHSSGYGKVGRFLKSPGDRIAQGERLVRVWDPDRRYAMVSVPSRQMNNVSVGTILNLRFPNGKTYHGKVSHIPVETLNPTNTSSRDQIVPIRVDAIGELWPSVPLGTSLAVTVKQ